MAADLVKRPLQVQLVSNTEMPYVSADFFKVAMVNDVYAISCYQLDYLAAADGFKASADTPIDAQARAVAKLVLTREGFQKLFDAMTTLEAQVPK